jgi:hypothetical protein
VLATLEPPRVSLWHAEPKDEDKPRLHAEEQLRRATQEAVDLIFKAWTRNLPHCDIDLYEPLNVYHRLRNWEELESAANGVGSSGAEAIGSAGEIDSRRTLIAIKADIEQGTDHALWAILNWRAAERIYIRQHRRERYRQRFATFWATWRDDITPEPADSAIAEAACVQRISRALGWYPHSIEKCLTND